MTCLDENTVLAFFESPRDPEVAERVDAHAAECEACREFLAAYAAMTPALAPSGPPPTEPPSAARPVAEPESRAGLPSAQAQAAGRVGQVLAGRWTIERLIGAGGMALVFAARDQDGRAVAIKLIRPELAREPELVRRLLREAYVANRVGHPGAIAVQGDGRTDDGLPFLVMERLEGETLRDHLTRSGPLEPERAVAILDQVLSVLAAAHAQGIVHRDLKPDNLWLEPSTGAVRVLDFGLARVASMTPMTRSGMTMGTVGYMPPEQARGLTALVDARSDVWAAGATLFTLLTGKILHEGSMRERAVRLATTAPVPSVRTLAPAIAAPLARVIDGALAFRKDARWADAGAMQAALRRARGGGAAGSSPAPDAARGGRRRLILWAAGLLLVIAGSLAAWAARWRAGGPGVYPLPPR